MPLIAYWAANLIAVLHGLLILCVLAGTALAVTGVLRRRRGLHVAFYLLIACLIASDLLLGECVLTRWERALRDAALPGSAYRGPYVTHYFGFLPPAVHRLGGPLLVAAALLALPAWWVVDRRRGRANEITA